MNVRNGAQSPFTTTQPLTRIRVHECGFSGFSVSPPSNYTSSGSGCNVVTQIAYKLRAILVESTRPSEVWRVRVGYCTVYIRMCIYIFKQLSKVQM